MSASTRSRAKKTAPATRARTGPPAAKKKAAPKATARAAPLRDAAQNVAPVRITRKRDADAAELLSDGTGSHISVAAARPKKKARSIDTASEATRNTQESTKSTPKRRPNWPLRYRAKVVDGGTRTSRNVTCKAGVGELEEDESDDDESDDDESDNSDSDNDTTNDSGSDVDRTWLRDARAQFNAVKFKEGTDRQETVLMVRRFLPLFRPLSSQEAHLFDNPVEAKKFMTQSPSIDLPVFVEGGANFSMIDRDAAERPIEQILEILGARSEEEHEFDDGSQAAGRRASKATTPAEIRVEFLKNTRSPEFPVNHPDIASPLLDYGLPSFVNVGECMLIHDLAREVLNVTKDNICHCKAPNIPHCDHYITECELVDVGQAWRHWQGTTMLSEPGTATHAHSDKYGMATTISCIEGEIGFGYLVRPSIANRNAVIRDYKAVGKWAFKVLRPGNTVWVPSGVIHFVFRKPKGGQTLGFAGHVLRKRDLGVWLKVLRTELQWAVKRKATEPPYRTVIAPLLREVNLLADKIESGGLGRRYGCTKARDLTTIRSLVAQLLSLIGKLPAEKKSGRVKGKP